jgi:hypothetical protein
MWHLANVQDDWPGGVRQQYKAAAPLVEALLRGLQPTKMVRWHSLSVT